ncbi:MAG: hypothetical protein OET44_19060, partial [Gammaproteobacteria bacterium]|nr:hypothetical protein [Gammaproteobacteria bacterium]
MATETLPRRPSGQASPRHHGDNMFLPRASAATAAAHRNEGREIHNPIEFFYLNQSLLFDILSSIPINSTVRFRARVATLHHEEATVSTGVYVA